MTTWRTQAAAGYSGETGGGVGRTDDEGHSDNACLSSRWLVRRSLKSPYKKRLASLVGLVDKKSRRKRPLHGSNIWRVKQLSRQETKREGGNDGDDI